MNSSETPPPEPLSEWFYVVGLESGSVKDTATGCVVIPVSGTSRDLHEGVMTEARRRLKISAREHAVIVAYSVEPMALADRRAS